LFRPVGAAIFAAAVLLAALAGWALFRRPEPPRDLAGASATATPEAAPTTSRPQSPAPQPSTREENRDLLAQNRPPEIASPNAPSLLLDSARGEGRGNRLRLSAQARAAILRIEVEPGASFTEYQFQVLDRAKRPVASATGGKANAHGAVSATLSVEALPAGSYLVRCYGARNGQRELIGEYDLVVERP
jgi:hypothetical protein